MDAKLKFLQDILDFRPDSLPSDSPSALADFLYQFLHQREKGTGKSVPPVYGFGAIWVYYPTSSVWVTLHTKEIASMVQNWDGVKLDGRDKYLRVSEDEKIVKMLINRMARNLAYGQDREGNDWIAQHEGGIAFSDTTLYAESANNKLTLKAKAPSHEDKTTAGFDFPCPTFPEVDPSVSDEAWVHCVLQYLKEQGSKYLHLYLSTVWKGCEEEASNIRFLAQFAGVALLGLATDQRFMRALVLQGEPGTGKSTFILMLKELFPKGVTSSIHPQVFGEPDRISTMAGSLFNFVEELDDKKPITNDAVLREVISGARIQVRDPYVRNYFFSPKCAHLWGCNRLPNITGAHQATWRRLALLRLNNMVRDTKDEIFKIERLVGQQEQKHLIAWALAGAVDAFAHNRYLIPESSKRYLAEWGQEADSVSSYVAEECSDEDRTPLLLQETKDAIKLTDLYRCYANWCRDFGHSAVSKSAFKGRIQSQGIFIRKRSVDVALVRLNEHGETRLNKILSYE